ncbi:MAG: hypothetical protein Q9214_006118 [Letrouitia sp. 1 TL-2023]
MGDLISYGKQAYQAQQYAAALEFFQTSLLQEKTPSIPALDGRAATYERLGNLEAALDDGRQLIRQFKTSCAGYLRVGNILQRQKNYDLAFKIYRYGLRNVPPEAPDYQLLQKMHHKLFLRCPPCKSGDPVKLFPPEIIEMVFSYLDFKNKVGIMRVARSWHDFVASVPKYWTGLDFSRAKVQIKGKAIEKYVRYSKGKISRATISQTAVPSPAIQGRITLHIATKCPGLEYLEVGSGLMGHQFSNAVSVASNLKNLIMSNRGGVTLDAVSQILGHCKRLETAEFRYLVTSRTIPVWKDMPNMHSLTLGLPYSMPGVQKSTVFSGHIITINDLLRVIPHIRSLSLQNWEFSDAVLTPNFSHLTKLEDLKLAKFGSEGFPRLPSSIVSLDLSDSDRLVRFLALGPASSEWNTFPKLARLLLPRLYHLQPVSLDALLRGNPNKLRTLNIASCIQITLSDIHRLIGSGNLDRIVELALNTSDFGDAEATSLANQCHDLRILDLSETAITGIGVKALILKPGDRLDRLTLRSCHGISNDAIEFAQSTGVEVIRREPNKPEVKAKRVRTTETGMYVTR